MARLRADSNVADFVRPTAPNPTPTARPGARKRLLSGFSSSVRRHNHENLVLKGPSRQIRIAWKLYGWKGLDPRLTSVYPMVTPPLPGTHWTTLKYTNPHRFHKQFYKSKKTFFGIALEMHIGSGSLSLGMRESHKKLSNLQECCGLWWLQLAAWPSGHIRIVWKLYGWEGLGPLLTRVYPMVTGRS